MLFLLNSAGVPSVAKFVQVNANPTDQPPTASITTPTTDVTILEGQAVSFSGTGTDPDGTVTAYFWGVQHSTAVTFVVSVGGVAAYIQFVQVNSATPQTSQTQVPVTYTKVQQRAI